MTTRFVMYYKLRQNFIILKFWKWEKKIDQRQNASLQSFLTMNSVRHQSIRARHAKVPINTTIVQNAILPPHFCENPFVRPSIGLFVRPSVCRKNFNIAHIFWSIKDTCITLMFGMNDPWKKSFQLAPSRDLCFDLDLFCPPGDNNYPNLLVKFTFTLLFRHDVIIQWEITCHIRQNGCFLWKRWCRIDKYLECPTSRTSVGILLPVVCCF